MADNLSKERILKKIQDALLEKTPKPYADIEWQTDVYAKKDDDLALVFAEAFQKVQGQFVFCEHLEDLVEKLKSLSEEKGWKNLHCWHPDLQEVFKELDFRLCRIGKNLDKADAGITTCEALVARTGSILMSTALPSGRALSIFPPVHICIAYTSHLVYDISDALDIMHKHYGFHLPSNISLATGPSRTADIEKTLVLGAHGPKEVYVFLVDAPEES